MLENPAYIKLSGRFTSDQYGSCFGVPTVKGTIRAKIPKLVQETNNCAIELKYEGFYRKGQVSQMRVSYSASLRGLGNQRGFVGGSMETQQTVEFAIDEMSETQMSGRYTSYNPADRGEFVLRIKNESKELATR